MILKLLFESPWLLLPVLVVIQSVLIAVWWWRRGRAWARIVWIGLGGIPALLLVSTLVVTPRERIAALCRDLAALVDEGDVAAIGRHLASDFEADGLDRSEFLDRAEHTLTRYHVDDARLGSIDVVFPRPKEGVAVFDAVCRIHSVDAYFDRLTSRWRVTYRRGGQLWLVTKIEPLPTPLSPIRDVRDWLR